jgi:hypothetical protein
MSALEKVEPGSANKNVLANVASAVPDIDEEDIGGIFQSVMALHMARSASDVPIEEFCDDIADEVQHAARELKLSAEERDKFVGRLKRIFGFDSLAVAAKSRDLQTDHDHVYLNGRIVTDIRPVFRNTPDEAPVGVVLFHMVKLTYMDRGRNGERANFYIALDDADLSSLKNLLERAELKAKTLRARLQSAGIKPIGDTKSQ